MLLRAWWFLVIGHRNQTFSTSSSPSWSSLRFYSIFFHLSFYKKLFCFLTIPFWEVGSLSLPTSVCRSFRHSLRFPLQFPVAEEQGQDHVFASFWTDMIVLCMHGECKPGSQLCLVRKSERVKFWLTIIAKSFRTMIKFHKLPIHILLFFLSVIFFF